MQSLTSDGNCKLVRYFGRLKKKIKQAYPKGSITEVYLEAERTLFASYYLVSNVPSRHTRCRRNEDVEKHNNHFSTLFVFELQGITIGGEGSMYLTNVEYIAAHLHVLLNYDDVKPYIGECYLNFQLSLSFGTQVY